VNEIVVKEHFKLRYCERVLGMDGTDKSELQQYIAENDNTLTKACTELYEESVFVWTGQINDFPVSSFHMKENFILVVGIKPPVSLVTLFPVDFGFPEKTNQGVAKDLLAEIEKHRAKLDKSREKCREQVEQKQMELDNTARELKLIEDQAKILRQRQYLLNEEIKQLDSEPSLIEKEIDKYAVQLINSLGFKLDQMSLRNGKRR